MPEKMIEIVQLTKIYKDFWGRAKSRAVKNLNLTIEKGEIFGLLGPNGSGKSTTIKILLGLLKPTEGQVAIIGKHPRSQSIKSKIGYLPEDSYLYPFLNATETLHFFGGLYGLSKAERHRRANDLIEMVGLQTSKNKRVGEYSKGMARRIGLAQALIGDPELLILDEPTSGLDPLGMAEIKNLILELKKRGKTILVSSHLLADMEDVCDRIGILYGGELCSLGQVNELLESSQKNVYRFDSLVPSKRQELESWLSKNSVSFTVKNERVHLEDYFLKTIREKTNKDIDGATEGTSAPEFLGENSSEKIIEELIKIPEVASEKVVEVEETGDLTLIETLIQEREESVQEDVEESEDTSNQVIDDLLKKSKE